jgi:transposase InsO family protein
MSLKKIKNEPDQTTPAKSRKRAGRKRPPTHLAYPIALRRQAVRLYLEEGIPLRLVAKELGVSRDSVIDWGNRYRKLGEAGLERRPSVPGPRRTTLPPAVHAAILTVKQEHPAFGVRRIAHWLQRSLFLRASPETVRQTLHRQEIPLAKPRKKPRKNPPKPRFFERATPNQMWQSDIFCFQLNNHNAYLIGFIDDHSRYIVGLGVYRGQTAENVLEVYRRAVGEYGAPKEMLTDNGRQYASWQGKTRFQAALARDRVHHIRSAPHHPMTLGKIERFWKTIWQEFLERARFETFEEAVERIAYWVKYYNHKRPHQGIGGLVPADRFFNVQKEMRQVIEKGIAQNVEQMALRGKPQEPFYMVGRVGGQNVVLQAERGQVKITVNGKETQGNNDEQQRQQREDEEGTDHSERTGEVPVGTGGMDGAAAAIGDLQGSEHPVERTLLLAGTGDGGYATSIGTAHTPAGGPGADAAAAHGETPGSEDGAVGKPDRAAGGRPAAAGTGEAGGLIVGPPRRDGHEEHAGTDGGDHRAGPGGHPDGDRGGPPAGDLPQDLLRTGGESAAGDGGGAGAGPSGETPDETRSGDCPASGSTGSSTPGATGAGTTGAHPAGTGGC